MDISCFMDDESVAALCGQIGTKLGIAYTPSVNINLPRSSIRTGPLSLWTQDKESGERRFLSIWMEHRETKPHLDYQLMTARLGDAPQGIKYGLTKNGREDFLERQCSIRMGEYVPLTKVRIYSKSVGSGKGGKVDFDHAIALFFSDGNVCVVSGSGQAFAYLEIETTSAEALDSLECLAVCTMRLECDERTLL